MKISSPSDSQELTYTARAGLKSKVFLPNVIGPSFSQFFGRVSRLAPVPHSFLRPGIN